MAIIYPLASSSKGNCIYIGTKNKGILVDAGIGIRSFAAHMSILGIQPQAIQGIFITHEHTDHVKGLARIQKALNIPVFGSKGTLRKLVEKQLIAPHIPMQLIWENDFELDEFCITAFSTPHDSEQSQCYRIRTPEGRSAVVCTDLGHVTDQIHNTLVGSDVVMLESNYEDSMLATGKYPYFLKKRIAGLNGHLSNMDCAQEISKLYHVGVKKFILGHLSEENNLPELAHQNVVHTLSSCGATIGQDFELMVAPRENQGKWIEF